MPRTNFATIRLQSSLSLSLLCGNRDLSPCDLTATFLRNIESNREVYADDFFIVFFDKRLVNVSLRVIKESSFPDV